MDDERLVREIKSGDTEALDELIQKYYRDIYAYCFRRMGCRADAEDVTQDVFLHFCRNFDSYTQRGKCRNYLYVIARNLCVNALQKKPSLPLSSVEPERLARDDGRVRRADTAGSVRAALRRLPEEQREVVLLRFYQDLKLKDIAQITDSGLSVTKYRLYQGLKALGKLLSKEDWR